MKKIGYLLVGLVAAIAFTSCTSVDKTTAKTGWASYSDIAIKDFDSVGIVTVETEVVETTGFLSLTKDTTGSTITYNALMEEAKKLEADDVINVRIDKVEQERAVL